MQPTMLVGQNAEVARYDGSIDVGLLSLFHFYHRNRDQPVCFAMGIDDGGGVGGLGKAEYGAVLFIYPIVNKIHSIFLLDGEVFLVGGGDGGCGDIAGSQLMDIEVKVVIPF